MSDQKKIKTALVSVFHKDGLDEIIKLLYAQGVTLLSTGPRSSSKDWVFPAMPLRTLRPIHRFWVAV